jgi:hypothetical protein
VITTPQLINLLAANAKPVRRLRPPLARTALWLLPVAAVFALLTVGHGVRPDLGQRLAQATFVVGILASLATALLAAIASFMISLPDRSRMWALLPLPTLIIWVSTVSYGCLTNWVDVGPAGPNYGEAARCFVTIVLTSLPLSVVMYMMLRHAALFRPTEVTLMASLAVAAVTATALSFFHDLDATVTILGWNLGIAVIIVAIGGVLGIRARSLA